MRQRPDAVDLEQLAGAVLHENPLPVNAKARSYEQRLALKALSIAAYDREHSAADLEEEIDLITALYGKDITKVGGSDDRERIAALNGRLASEIRTGRWDKGPPALMALLMAQVRARLARCNPKYLKATLGD